MLYIITVLKVLLKYIFLLMKL